MIFKTVKMFRNIIIKSNCLKITKAFKCTISPKDTELPKVSGFAQAFEKFSEPTPNPTPVSTSQKSFATLLRNSKFMDLGDPEGKIVVGKIFHIVDNDLYIDFGWKFHCVCPRPTQNSDRYIRGASVRLRIKELELSTKFLGSDKDLTILEADAILLGLVDKK